MEFKVKRDFLNVFLVNIILAFLVCVSIPFAYNTWVFIVVFTVCLSIIILYDTAVIFASCKVDNDILTFKTGIFSYKINLNSIVKVEKSKNFYGSLALSCDRVRILTNVDGKNKVYYVSVMDNEKLMSIISPKSKTTTAPAVEKKETTVEETPTTKTVATKKTTTKKTSSTTTKKATSTKKKTTTAKKSTK